MPSTVRQYLDALPEERRRVVAKVREVINRHLPDGYEEGIQYGMIGWYVPKARYPAGYHAKPSEPLPFVHLAAQKAHYALYLLPVSATPALQEWFATEARKLDRKLDMGKSCLRFKGLDDVPLELVGKTVARLPVAAWIEAYEACRGASPKKRATKRTASKKASSPRG
jgi:hypothetical protein